MAFIIDSYNRFDVWDRMHSKYIFEINRQKYAIKEVELEWGLPQLPDKVDREQYPESYFVYNTYQDAMRFVMQMKMINAR